MEGNGLIYNEQIWAEFTAFLDAFPVWKLSKVSRSMQQKFSSITDEAGRRLDVGCGETTLDQYVKRCYPSSQDALQKLERKIRMWLKEMKRASRLSVKVRENLASYQWVKKAIGEAKASGKFVVVVGPSGTGKSIAALDYINRYTNGDHCYIETIPGMTQHQFLRLLANKLGLTKYEKSDMLIESIARHLSEWPKVLVIDDTHWLNDMSILYLRYIWNKAGVGIVLMGTRELEERLRTAKLDHIRSRMSLMFEVSRPQRSEIRQIMRDVFGEAADDEAISAIEPWARSHADLDDIIRLVHARRQQNGAAPLALLIKKISPRKMGAGTPVVAGIRSKAEETEDEPIALTAAGRR